MTEDKFKEAWEKEGELPETKRCLMLAEEENASIKKHMKELEVKHKEIFVQSMQHCREEMAKHDPSSPEYAKWQPMLEGWASSALSFDVTATDTKGSNSKAPEERAKELEEEKTTITRPEEQQEKKHKEAKPRAYATPARAGVDARGTMDMSRVPTHGSAH